MVRTVQKKIHKNNQNCKKINNFPQIIHPTETIEITITSLISYHPSHRSQKKDYREKQITRPKKQRIEYKENKNKNKNIK